MNRLAAIASPINAVAMCVASISSGTSPLSAELTALTMSAAGNCMSGRVVKVPGIAS